MIFTDLMQELWFFEYHESTNNLTSPIIEFVGSVNRKKFIPSYGIWILGPIYDRYEDKRNKILPKKNQFTDNKFLQKEREPAIFVFNAAKMYIWAFAVSLCLFGLQRLAAQATTRWKVIHAKFKHTKVKGVIFMILIEAYIQFVSFLFF